MSFKKLFAIDNKWFFTELPFVLKALSFFIKGDLIVLAPLLLGILLIGFFSIKFMLVMIAIYITVRNLGEMIYWFAHQFYERKYRPPDWGFKNLDNHAIYILHQTMAMAGTVIGTGMTIAVLIYMK